MVRDSNQNGDSVLTRFEFRQPTSAGRSEMHCICTRILLQLYGCSLHGSLVISATFGSSNSSDKLRVTAMRTPFLGERGSAGGREGAAKAAVADQISQAVKTTANLIHLTENSSPAKTELMKCPKNLLAKTSTMKNTKNMIQQMPLAVSSLDAHIEHGLRSVPYLKAVAQLLGDMENCQITNLSQEGHPPSEHSSAQ